jgi:hypothetical protein
VTLLQLLSANFSDTARRRYVYAKPTLLSQSLSLLRDSVRKRYVPNADSFVQQANRQVVAEKQRALKQHAPKFKIKP